MTPPAGAGFERLRISPGARQAVQSRCGGRCEGCGLEWPWTLSLFLVDEAGPPAAANLRVLCGPCSAGRAGPFAPLLGRPGLRERVLGANNRRNRVEPLTPARRRRLIAARGGRCEACGVAAGERQLDVHHVLGVLRGGDDRESNLRVLCFACHHHLRPCATGCGGWAKRPARLCRHCETRRRLEAMHPDLGWEEVKRRVPGLARSWPQGYEPQPFTGYASPPPDEPSR